jgi:hypothetical protein
LRITPCISSSIHRYLYLPTPCLTPISITRISFAPPKQESALRHGEALVRRRPADLFDGAPGLLDSLLAWADAFRLPLFARRQRALLTALVAHAPRQCVPRLVHRMCVWLN